MRRRPAHVGDQLARGDYRIEIFQVAGWIAGKSPLNGDFPEGVEADEVSDEIGHIPAFASRGCRPLAAVEGGKQVLETSALSDGWCELAVRGTFDGDDRRSAIAGESFTS
jgi:hypothetical protein